MVGTKNVSGDDASQVGLLATTVAPSVIRRVVGSAVMTNPVSSAAVCQAYLTSPTAPGLPFSSCRGASSIYAAAGSSVQGPAATNEPLIVTAPSAAHSVPAEVRVYGHLFRSPDPGAQADLFADLDPDSETVLTGCQLEASLADVPVGEAVQFERLGYFVKDPDSRPDALVFDRTVTLKDTWAKVQARSA